MLTITAYETEKDFNNSNVEYHYGSDRKSTQQVRDDFEQQGFWLVTTTNEDGKLGS
ncbi:hypothetical protein SBX64_15985 [Vibrio rhizosphaerae]|uniref:Uncharacterized protein n=1 Tax=Vibrio rhizosphaerae TaxID=398736 RepID=A0ABU4J0K3_9VIBR|nr:hypothetical protein [Vibrio rhizosphaerae]MDW6094039.1 hypothetical protein [Vibrio rhizosphaerae]